MSYVFAVLHTVKTDLFRGAVGLVLSAAKRIAETDDAEYAAAACQQVAVFIEFCARMERHAVLGRRFNACDDIALARRDRVAV